eukprot:3170426-Rhodomonas_salina.4
MSWLAGCQWASAGRLHAAAAGIGVEWRARRGRAAFRGDWRCVYVLAVRPDGLVVDDVRNRWAGRRRGRRGGWGVRLRRRCNHLFLDPRGWGAAGQRLRARGCAGGRADGCVMVISMLYTVDRRRYIICSNARHDVIASTSEGHNRGGIPLEASSCWSSSFMVGSSMRISTLCDRYGAAERSLLLGSCTCAAAASQHGAMDARPVDEANVSTDSASERT